MVGPHGCGTVRGMAQVIRTYDDETFIEKLTGEIQERQIGKAWSIENFDVDHVGYNESVVVDVTVTLKLRLPTEEVREVLAASESREM